MKFEDIEWHDQVLNSISIDRADPGKNDSIKLQVEVDDIGITVLFEDVYFADIKMNFGVIAPESIKYAIIKNDDIEITNIQRKWNSVGVELNDLFLFELNTNSTNSLIKIYALSYKMSKGS